MPGVGKSSIGVILAKELGCRFTDADLVIQEREGRLLKEIIAAEGIDGFLNAESEALLSIKEDGAVIATGGSAVYSDEAMRHLKETGTVVYLRLPYEDLRKRLGNLRNRGVVLREGQSLKDLFEERTPLYEKYADAVVDEKGLNHEETLAALLRVLSR